MIRVALTFDAEHPDRPDCPPGVQEGIVAFLERHAINATFFMQGRWVQAYPDLARSIAGNGHLVGNHSFYHARLPLLSDAGLVEDVREAEQVIRELAGVDPRPWFRCPFGAGAYDDRVLSCLESMGYRDFEFDVPSTVDGHVVVGDWMPGQTGASVAGWVLDGIRRRGDEAVVVLHTWPAATLAALPEIVARLRDAGASFVRLDEIGLTAEAVQS